MGAVILGAIQGALARRRAAAVEAEALVLRYGEAGVAMALAAAQDANQTEARRAHHTRVLRIAERRLAALRDADTGTRYQLVSAWERRAQG